MFFQVFIVFGVAGFVKSMQCGYSLDAELNSTSIEPSRLKFEEKYREICWKYEQKSSFYDKYVNLTIMVESFYWNSIGSWILTHKIDCWRIFL